MKKPTLVLLAAGMGSRFGGLKQLSPVGPEGQPIIEYSLYDAARAGFGEVVLVIKREMADEVEQALLRRARGRIACRTVFQSLDMLPEGLRVPDGRKKPWGTGHAAWCARDAVDRPFGVINADDFYGLDAFELLAGFLSAVDSLRKMCLISYAIENTLSDSGPVRRGVCEVKDGVLKSVTERDKIAREAGGIFYEENGEKHGIPTGTPISMSTWGLSPQIFGYIERDLRGIIANAADPLECECKLTSAVDDMIRLGMAEITAIPTTAGWHGVTYQQDKPAVRAALAGMHRNGIYPALR